MKEDKTIYMSFKCFIDEMQHFGLLDNDGILRATSWNIEGILKRKMMFGWGTIIYITVNEKGIKFGKEVGVEITKTS